MAFFLLLLLELSLALIIILVINSNRAPQRVINLTHAAWFKHGEIFTHPYYVYKGYGKLVPTERCLVHFVTLERIHRAEDLREPTQALQRVYRRLLVDPEAREEPKRLWEIFLALPVGGDPFRSALPSHRLIIGYFHIRDGSQRKLIDVPVNFHIVGSASAHPTAVNCAHAVCEIMMRIKHHPTLGDREVKFLQEPGLNTFRYWAIMLFTAYLFEVDRFQKRR